MKSKTKNIRLLLISYWVLLAYVIAALGFWYYELNRQNNTMANLREELHFQSGKNELDSTYYKIENARQRKIKQFAGEGFIFLLLILAGATYIYYSFRKQLRDAEKQQNFMMAITHELKTPIAIANLNLETLQRRKLDEVKQQEIIATTLQETNRMNNLCRNLLLESQMESGFYVHTNEHTDLSQLIQNSLQVFVLRYKERAINSDVESGIEIVADKHLIEILVNNLIENALKYSPKSEPVFIALKSLDQHIELTISDHGNGIAEGERKNVFKKHYRIGNDATKKAKGTGMGLYLVKRIVEISNATVNIESNLPKGSKFIVRFKK